jgi:hypothetical protein
MIWLTWRQHRKQALFAVTGLAVLAAVLIPTGRQMYEALDATGLNRCLDRLGDAALVEGRCSDAAQRFNTSYGSRAPLSMLLLFPPLLAGLFWGAPLVAREIEHGTHRFVWTQGVTQLRWALVKFGLIIASTTIVAVAYALLVSWWLTPITRAGSSRFSLLFFDLHGVAPMAYTMFAVALGVFAGTLAKKALPAMAITLVGFIGVRIAVAALARPRFQAPVQAKAPVTADVPREPNPALEHWILSNGIYDRNGNLTQPGATSFCQPTPNGQAPSECGPAGAYNQWTYQPADRFWPFQYVETGIYVALAVLLLYLALRQVRRRIA